jgi:hypothetical protein
MTQRPEAQLLARPSPHHSLDISQFGMGQTVPAGQLRTLRQECAPTGGPHHGDGRGNSRERSTRQLRVGGDQGRVSCPWSGASSHRQCPTHRDFVPWRFSDAGRTSAWIGSTFRRPKTCTEAAVGSGSPYFGSRPDDRLRAREQIPRLSQGSALHTATVAGAGEWPLI